VEELGLEGKARDHLRQSAQQIGLFIIKGTTSATTLSFKSLAEEAWATTFIFLALVAKSFLLSLSILSGREQRWINKQAHKLISVKARE